MNIIPVHYHVDGFTGNFHASACIVESYIKGNIKVKKSNVIKIAGTEIDEYTITIPKNDKLLCLNITDRSNSKNRGGMRLKFAWETCIGNQNETLTDMISPIVNFIYLGSGDEIPRLTTQYGVDEQKMTILRKVPSKNVLQLDILSEKSHYVWMNIICKF